MEPGGHMPRHAELVQLDHVALTAVLSGDATSLSKAYSGGLLHGVILSAREFSGCACQG